MVTREKLCAHRQLVRGKAQRFACNRFRNTIQFKQNVTRPNRGDPVFGLPLALPHPRFRRARGHRFVRENADPQFALAFHVASERDTRRFKLRVGDPGTFECLQTELAEIDSKIARSSPLSASPLDFRYFTRFGINGINFSLTLQPVRGLAAAVMVWPPEALVPPSYKSSISPRSCRRPYLLPRSRNQSASARCAAELSLLGTILSAKSPRH